MKIGWVGATPWRSGDLEQLSPFIGPYLQSRRMMFHHSGHTGGGAPTAAEQLGVPKNIVSTLPLVPILSYPSLFQPIDIGLVPLNDVKFNHAKSFIKGLEYAAAGVPFISSYAPEYEYLSKEGEIGRVAYSHDDWIYHLDELRNKELRTDEAAYNLEKLQNFTMEARGPEWNEVFTTLLADSEQWQNA